MERGSWACVSGQVQLPDGFTGLNKLMKEPKTQSRAFFYCSPRTGLDAHLQSWGRQVRGRSPFFWGKENFKTVRFLSASALFPVCPETCSCWPGWLWTPRVLGWKEWEAMPSKGALSKPSCPFVIPSFPRELWLLHVFQRGISCHLCPPRHVRP